MTRRVLLLAVAVAVVSLPVHRPVPVTADSPHPTTLTALVAPNSLIRDANGDGLADSVAARVIVPASPAPADRGDATNLAARLGFTTPRIRPVMPGKAPASSPRNTVHAGNGG